MELKDKVALVVGGGQAPGKTIGNGRATAIQFAREGACVFVGDIDLSSAEETVAMIKDEGFQANALDLDVCDESSIARFVSAASDKAGKIDILHNNVGVSISGGDAPIEDIEVENFDRLVQINLRGMVLTTKHALPHMRRAESGVILNVSSLAAWKPYPLVGYKTTKMGVIALTEQTAALNARYGIRANAILPGLMNTPMAIEQRITNSVSREDVVAARDKQVPLRRKMGTGWDIANAAVFLASEKASYITGAALPVDGGLSVV